MKLKLVFTFIVILTWYNSIFSQTICNANEEPLEIIDELVFIPKELIEKKVSDISFIEFNATGDINPIVRQLDYMEKIEEYTPASVAYNFIQAIVNGDKLEMIHLSIGQFHDVICYQYDELIQIFHQPGKLNIFGWKKLPNDYEIVPLLVQAENEDGSVQKVYMACIPSSEINVKRFQDVTRDGETNVKVLVNNYSGHWLVEGFK